MKWFKHFSNAYKSLKINAMIDDLGIKGYGYYWLLVEVLAENFDGENVDIDLHYVELSSRIRIKSRSKLIQFLQKLQSHSLITFSNSGEFFTINFPILKELQDRDSKYNRPRRKKNASLTTLEEEVEEEREEEVEEEYSSPIVPEKMPKKILDQALAVIDKDRQNVPVKVDLEKWIGSSAQEKSITPDEIIDLWNQSMGKEFGHCPGFGGGEHRSNVLEAIKYLKNASDWEALFLKCRQSKHLTGGSESGWTVNLLWLVNYDNALKVLSDVYDDQKALRNLFAGIKSEGAAS